MDWASLCIHPVITMKAIGNKIESQVMAQCFGIMSTKSIMGIGPIISKTKLALTSGSNKELKASISEIGIRASGKMGQDMGLESFIMATGLNILAIGKII